MHLEPDIIISSSDLERLMPVLDQYDTDAAESLDAELRRATIVDAQVVPADVVTMHSEVEYEDCATTTRRSITLVYPNEADAARNKISILAPIGSALLGLRVGQTIEWQLPAGKKKIRVLAVRR